MKRIYQSVITSHLHKYKQMAILTGPREVGKTSLCKEVVSNSRFAVNLSWNNFIDRETILAGPEKLYDKIESFTKLGTEPPVVVFEDLNLHKQWKNLLKGFYD